LFRYKAAFAKEVSKLPALLRTTSATLNLRNGYPSPADQATRASPAEPFPVSWLAIARRGHRHLSHLSQLSHLAAEVVAGAE